jgi:hypothetical protein
MARPKEPGRLEKVTMNLWHGDFDAARVLYHDDAGRVIRNMLRRELKQRKREVKSSIQLSRVGGDNA